MKWPVHRMIVEVTRKKNGGQSITRKVIDHERRKVVEASLKIIIYICAA